MYHEHAPNKPGTPLAMPDASLSVVLRELDDNNLLVELEQRLGRLVEAIDGPKPVPGGETPKSREPNSMLIYAQQALGHRQQLTELLLLHVRRLEELIGG